MKTIKEIAMESNYLEPSVLIEVFEQLLDFKTTGILRDGSVRAFAQKLVEEGYPHSVSLQCAISYFKDLAVENYLSILKQQRSECGYL